MVCIKGAEDKGGGVVKWIGILNGVQAAGIEMVSIYLKVLAKHIKKLSHRIKGGMEVMMVHGMEKDILNVQRDMVF